MKRKTSFLYWMNPILIPFLLFQSCSLGPPKDGSKIQIRFEFQSLPPSLQSLFFIPYSDGAAGGLPEKVSGFSCLAVNVMGEGIEPQDRKQRVSDEYCSYSGVTSVPISIQQESVTVDLIVPSGKNRTLQILGVYDTNGFYCSMNSEIGNSGDLSEKSFTFFEVGSVRRDLFFNQVIDIPNTYDSLSSTEDKYKRDVSCPQPTPSPSESPPAAAAPAPTIVTVSPSEGTNVAGTTVTVTGTGFQNGATVCFTSTSDCYSATFNDSTSLSSALPAHAAGTFDVIVKNPDGQMGTQSSAYSFVETSSLFFWYKADKALNAGSTPLNGATVTSWPDSSGNGFTLGKFGSDVDPTNLPTFKTSEAIGTKSKPAVLFGIPSDNTIKRLTAAIPTPSQPNPTSYTLFVVAKATANSAGGSSYPALGLTSDGNNSLFFGLVADALSFGKNTSGYNSYWTLVGGWTTKFYRWTVLVSDVNSSAGVSLFSQESASAIGITTGSANGRGGLWDRITLGDNSFPIDNYFSGTIAEVMGYTAALSDTNRLLVQAYLANKYGFPR